MNNCDMYIFWLNFIFLFIPDIHYKNRMQDILLGKKKCFMQANMIITRINAKEKIDKRILK